MSDEDNEEIEDEEPDNICDACGDDHETHECDVGFCATCMEILDNCDCDKPVEIDAEEYVKIKKERKS